MAALGINVSSLGESPLQRRVLGNYGHAQHHEMIGDGQPGLISLLFIALYMTASRCQWSLRFAVGSVCLCPLVHLWPLQRGNQANQLAANLCRSPKTANPSTWLLWGCGPPLQSTAVHCSPPQSTESPPSCTVWPNYSCRINQTRPSLCTRIHLSSSTLSTSSHPG